MRPILSLDRLIHLLMFVFRYSGVKDINCWGNMSSGTFKAAFYSNHLEGSQ